MGLSLLALSSKCNNCKKKRVMFRQASLKSIDNTYGTFNTYSEAIIGFRDFNSIKKNSSSKKNMGPTFLPLDGNDYKDLWLKKKIDGQFLQLKGMYSVCVCAGLCSNYTVFGDASFLE